MLTPNRWQTQLGMKEVLLLNSSCAYALNPETTAFLNPLLNRFVLLINLNEGKSQPLIQLAQIQNCKTIRVDHYSKNTLSLYSFDYQ